MYKLLFSAILTFLTTQLQAQPRIISGPMLGPVELRDAKVWLEVSPEVKSVVLQYHTVRNLNNPDIRIKPVTKSVQYKGELGKEFNPITITVGGLNFNTAYHYNILVNGKAVAEGEFVTKDLWQWRKAIPDFNFLTGSCAYFNEPEFDRPGKPYGGDSTIFESMAKEKSAFMLWLGDAWYTREVDYFSEWGLWYRASHDRAMPIMKDFLKAMPQFGIWDDHDFGPNNFGTSYNLKEASRNVFNSYFCNPSSGENGQGIYTMTSWGDADIFMTDGRWWRSADEMKDSVDGKPNHEKVMLGKQQMKWLKNALLYSNATFKIIAVGSQVLNPVSPYEVWHKFPAEYNELMDFLAENKINGVIFLTGDRHHSEIIKVNRPGTYPMYDITVSPLTSGTHKFGGPEKDNPYRILGIDEKQNYSRFSFSGKKNERKLTVEFFGIKGEKLGEWVVNENELKTPKTSNQ